MSKLKRNAFFRNDTMSDIDYLGQLPKIGDGPATENNFILSEDDSQTLNEESKTKLIQLLKREEATTTSEVVHRFKNGDKEAAELLVRTFYPYVESLLVALEKRDLQERASERGGIAPALISSGGRRKEFLNNFFTDFVNKAADIDLSKGIRLYLYSHCAEPFAKRIQSSLESSKSEAAYGKDGRQEHSLFLDDEPGHKVSASTDYKSQDYNNQNRDSLFFEDIPKPKMRISGIPASRSISNKEEAAKSEPSSASSSGGVKGPVYVRQSDSVSGGISIKSAEVRRTGPWGGAPNQAQLLRSDSANKMAISHLPRNNVHLAPALSPSEELPEKEPVSASPAAPAQLSRKAQFLANALKRLAATDLEAYRTVVMRYFAGCSFAELCQKLEVTSAGEIGLRLLRGLLSLSGEPRSN